MKTLEEQVEEVNRHEKHPMRQAVFDIVNRPNHKDVWSVVESMNDVLDLMEERGRIAEERGIAKGREEERERIWSEVRKKAHGGVTKKHMWVFVHELKKALTTPLEDKK